LEGWSEARRQGGPSRPKKAGQRLGLVEQKLPNGSFELFERYMTRKLGRLE